jgi:lysophospholipase L1-like esterase
MNRAALTSLALRALLMAWVLLMAALTNLPWPPLLLFAALGCSLLLPDLSRGNSGEYEIKATILASLCTLSLPFGLLYTTKHATFVETYYAVLAWLIAGAIALTSHRSTKAGLKRWWKILAMLWAYSGALLWLAAAYVQDVPSTFYIGLVIAGLLLVVTLLWFRPPAWSVMALNTGLLLLILLPVVDFLTRPPQRVDPHPEVAGNAYLYDVATRDPHAFRYWWGKYLGQYDKLMREVFIPDYGHGVPFRTRTNSETTFFQSHIRINSLGFRGKEIAREKGNTYRIVAMGESTTFGFTLTPEHLPWPEVLEQLIRERLSPGRPVEVINTGLPHHNLENNLYRLRAEILALKPDMIISYHGWNGFRWLYPSLPPIYEKHYPLFRNRPLHLLAECEFRLKMFIFKRHLASKPVLEMPPVSRLLETKYADLYRELTDIARTNNIRLVLGNYSMAVNGNSDRKVCEFYREVFPSVYPAIKVNVMHTMLVKELVRQHADLIYADTNPGLDGEYRKFIDLVHFAPDGDRQLAENFFTAIKGVLTTNLSEVKASR